MINHKRCLFSGILSMGLIFAITTAVSAQNVPNVPQKAITTVDLGAVAGGQLSAGTGLGATGAAGDVVYRNETLLGSFFRPFPGYRDYDDLHMESGGELIEYRISVFGSTVSGSQAGSPFDATTSLWTDTQGNPSLGVPDAMIPGSDCSFVGVPAGGVFTLTCKVPAGITVPANLWLAIEFSTDNSGWLLADIGPTCDNFDIGFNEDFWVEEDLINGGFSFFFFGGCPAAPFSSMVARVVVTGKPWACCDIATSSCANIQESDCAGLFTQGTLCNDLNPPCSDSGACCNVATGVCTDSFASQCGGFLEVFTAGTACANLSAPCEAKGDNVPTVSQWGMIVLSALLLTGLTIKFGRRRSATA